MKLKGQKSKTVIVTLYLSARQQNNLQKKGITMHIKLQQSSFLNA